jgi:transcriptional regulator with XRE-family HTH domain
MFANYLREFRDNKGVSKTDLAKMIGVTTSYVLNLEKGREKPPTQAIVRKIIKALSLNKEDAENLLTCSVLGRTNAEDFAVIVEYAHKQEMIGRKSLQGK